MSKIEKSSKFEKFRNSQRSKKLFEIPEAKDYSAPSNDQARKHIRIMSGFRPNSEMPGNDR